MDLLNIQPHKVSKDLNGYITYIYGAPKTGKTTLATQMPKHLLLAFERGYNALPGVIVQDITSWGDMKKVMRELKKPEVREAYDAIIVDTVDIASDACQRYICSQLGIESMGEGGYKTNSWKKFKDEFNYTFRTLANYGYAVFFLGHQKESVDEETGKIIIRPAISPKSAAQIIEGMADIYGYAHQKSGHNMSVLTLRHEDETISCGGRIKYLPNEIEMSYENLTTAMKDAIEKEAMEHNNEFITEEKDTITEFKEYDYDALMNEIGIVVNGLFQKNEAYYGPKIKVIVERYLGKGKMVGETTPDQAELVSLILDDIKTELVENDK